MSGTNCEPNSPQRNRASDGRPGKQLTDTIVVKVPPNPPE
jgi:hypothetical protein